MRREKTSIQQQQHYSPEKRSAAQLISGPRTLRLVGTCTRFFLHGDLGNRNLIRVVNFSGSRKAKKRSYSTNLCQDLNKGL